MRKILLLALSIISLGLTWCFFSSQQTTKISFDGFNMQINSEFQETDASIIQNKQIINKVVKAYKITNTQWFDKNIIVAKTTVNSDIDSENFWKTSIEKIKTQIPSYEQISSWKHTFNCNGEEIIWIYSSYKLSENFMSDKDRNYMIAQYYFKKGEQYGYIISFWGETQEDIDSAISAIKTIWCE